MNKTLDPKITEIIITNLNKAYEIEKLGNIKLAAKKYLESWSMLPETAISWDESRMVARALIIFYYRNTLFEEAKLWIDTAFQCHIPEIDTSMDILAGSVFFDSGDEDKAL